MRSTGRLMVALALYAGAACGRATPAGEKAMTAQSTLPRVSAAPDESLRATITVGGGHVTYWRTHALDAPNPDVRSAVVVVHGLYQNASDYFVYARDAARIAGAEKTSLVIAPLFRNVPGEADDLVWKSSTYDWGAEGRATSGANASSFDVVDALLAELAHRERFPHLEFVVVTGHSAGGQFTQRYVGYARAESVLPGVKVRYVVVNPSSYMYLDDARYVEGRGFVKSDPSFDGCPTYDDYKYGLRNRPPPLVRAMPDAELRARYLAKDVVYLLGESDTCNSLLDPTCNDHSLSVTCASMMQGRTRLERGRRFRKYLATFFPSAQHTILTVPRVGHSGRDMYRSANGRRVLFDPAPLDGATGDGHETESTR